MPVYEYVCRVCGSKFDKLVRMSTKTEDIECPKCGQRQAEKAVSLFGAISSGTSSSASLASTAACGPST